ncbi:hypothetical protein [Salibacterium qingdaonense]|nr:hypothetical protein [Salibacterium qingdaonense]
MYKIGTRMYNKGTKHVQVWYKDKKYVPTENPALPDTPTTFGVIFSLCSFYLGTPTPPIMVKLTERSDRMEIKIRNINPSIVQEFDEKAKKQGLSRQEYLRSILENYTLLNNINDRELEYQNRLEKNTKMLEIISEKLDKNNEFLHYLTEDDS